MTHRELDPHTRRELALLVDRKIRAEARRRGERLTLTPEIAGRLVSYRKRWIAAFAGVDEIADEATFEAVRRALLPWATADHEDARALRSVLWRDIVKERGAR